MKKIIIALIIASAIGAMAVETNYWPNATNMLPQQIGKTYGNNAAVVGATATASLGSIAIASDVGIAVVKDAVGAVQIGNGTNTTAGSVKVGSTQIYPDARGVAATNFVYMSSLTTTGRIYITTGGMITNITTSGQ